jgi:hypothetical protein
MKKLVVLSVAFFLLTAFRAEVVRFHDGVAPAGQTIVVRPVDSTLTNSMEFASHAKRLSDGLAKVGFKPADADATADLVAEMAYSSMTRAPLRDSNRSPVSVGVGVGGVGSHVGVSIGTVFGMGKKSAPAGMRVHMVDVRLKTADGKTLWEGRANTEIREDRPKSSFADALPGLVDSLVADFPGPSGVTTVYKPPRS